MDNKTAVVGIDMGATTTRVALCNLQGKPLNAEPVLVSSKVSDGPSAWLEATSKGFRAACELVRLAPEQIAAVGLATAGPASRDGVIGRSTNFGGDWNDCPIRQALAETLRQKVVYENDANAALAGEAFERFGLGGAKNVVLFTTGSGLGGAAIVEGTLLRGRRGMGMEAGHIMLAAPEILNGTPLPTCGCGRRGCMEAYTSLNGLAWQLEAALTGVDLGNHELADSSKTMLQRAGRLRDLAGKGDEFARQLILQQAVYLGLCCWQVTAPFDPDAIIIGGGMNDATDQLKEAYMARVKETFDSKAFAQQATTAQDGVQIFWAQLGDHAGWRGAALSAIESLN